jgi:hypothetical protein
MNCFDCRFLGAKVGHWYRCHRLPEALSRDKAQKYQLHPDTYHSDERPCPDFAAKAR